MPFWGTKWSTCPEQIFFGTSHYYYCHLPVGPFNCAKFTKNSYSRSKVVRCPISGPKCSIFAPPPIKWPICPNQIFFRIPFNESCSFHSCLSIFQKSKWDINLLVKYWQLKNTEISLAEPLLAVTREPGFFQARSFSRMLINHKNFHLTQIPDKTNDMSFLESQKKTDFGRFLNIFGHFCPMRIFSKLFGSVTYNYMEP